MAVPRGHNSTIFQRLTVLTARRVACAPCARWWRSTARCVPGSRGPRRPVETSVWRPGLLGAGEYLVNIWWISGGWWCWGLGIERYDITDIKWYKPRNMWIWSEQNNSLRHYIKLKSSDWASGVKPISRTTSYAEGDTTWISHWSVTAEVGIWLKIRPSATSRICVLISVPCICLKHLETNCCTRGVVGVLSRPFSNPSSESNPPETVEFGFHVKPGGLQPSFTHDIPDIPDIPTFSR